MYSKTSVKHSTPFGQWFYYYHIVLFLSFVFSLIVLKCSVAYACLICEWTTSALSNISKSQYGFCGFNQLTVCMCVQLKENHRENQSNCGLDDLTNKFILCAKHPMKNSSHLTIREVKQLFYVLTGNQSTQTEFHLSNTTWVNVRHIISFCFSVGLNCKKQFDFIYLLHILSSRHEFVCFWKKILKVD